MLESRKRKQPHMLPAPSNEPTANVPAKAEPQKQSPVRRKAPNKRPTPKRNGALPQWHVILHNDEINTMLHVIQSIVTITPLTRGVATRCMRQAHAKGRSRLLTTHRERAELIRDQFTKRSLTVTLEPAESA